MRSDGEKMRLASPAISACGDQQPWLPVARLPVLVLAMCGWLCAAFSMLHTGTLLSETAAICLTPDAVKLKRVKGEGGGCRPVAELIALLEPSTRSRVVTPCFSAPVWPFLLC